MAARVESGAPVVIRLTDNHAPRLAKIDPTRIIPALGHELTEVAQVIATDAATSIIDGGISGSAHVPSAPGQPPNADTHDLDQSLHVGALIEVTSRIKTSVIADSDHALYQELGTTKMEERPFLRPAVERQRKSTVKGLADTFNKQAR